MITATVNANGHAYTATVEEDERIHLIVDGVLAGMGKASPTGRIDDGPPLADDSDESEDIYTALENALMMWWTSADGQASIACGIVTEPEAYVEMLSQCGTDEQRADVLNGTFGRMVS